VTVGYFQTLAPRDAEAIAEHFRGHEADLVVNGYGVANNQAAYFTVDGLEDARGELKGMAIAFSADDPHVTFGVSPANPRDVHNVPKKAQFAMGPFKVHALFHLQQGTKTFW